MSLFGCPVRFLITQIKTGPCNLRFGAQIWKLFMDRASWSDTWVILNKQKTFNHSLVIVCIKIDNGTGCILDTKDAPITNITQF